MFTFSIVLIFNTILKTNQENSLENLREQHTQFLINSPFKETLTWDKKKRKLEGLPPNRYFEQMWGLTINPATGKLDDGNLTIIREQLNQQRLHKEILVMSQMLGTKEVQMI